MYMIKCIDEVGQLHFIQSTWNSAQIFSCMLSYRAKN